MSYYRFLLFVLIFSQLIPQPSYGRFDLIPGSRYESARGNAMGDALIPFADDVASALFYNPAGIAKIRKPTFEPLNIQGYGNGSFVSSLGTNSTNVFNLSSYSSNLQSPTGNRLGAGFSIFPYGGLPGFAIGLLYQSEVSAVANASAISYRTSSQIIPTIGTGFRLFNGILRLGYSVQWVNEAVGSATVSSGSSLNWNNGIAQGSALSHNMGLTVSIPLSFLPTISFVGRNLLGAHYISYQMMSFSTSPSGLPMNEAMSFDGALGSSIRLGQGAAVRISCEYRDALNSSRSVPIAHLAIGTEVTFKDRVFLRGGWRGGYPSVGVGLKRPGADLSLAWYGEEIGNAYQSLQDRRVVLQYQLGLF